MLAYGVEKQEAHTLPEGKRRMTDGVETLKVITSGGFAAVYRDVLPEFEQRTGIKVETGSGASEGTGPETIRNELANGTRADVVILGREGLQRLIDDGRIAAGSAMDLATAALGAAVRAGSSKPDIGTDVAFMTALIDAGQVVAPGSTSGLYVRDKVFPKLNLPETVKLRLEPGGTEAAEVLRAGKANILIGPISELIQEIGIDVVGLLPSDLQLIVTFTAAIVKDCQMPEAAKRLIDFLSSDTDDLLAAIQRVGMELPSTN